MRECMKKFKNEICENPLYNFPDIFFMFNDMYEKTLYTTFIFPTNFFNKLGL